MTAPDSSPRNEAEQEYLRLLGSHVRQWRERKGLTQEQLAPIVGFSRSYMPETESGKRNISFINLSKIIDVMGINDLAKARRIQGILHRRTEGL